MAGIKNTVSNMFVYLIYQCAAIERQKEISITIIISYNP